MIAAMLKHDICIRPDVRRVGESVTIEWIATCLPRAPAHPQRPSLPRAASSSTIRSAALPPPVRAPRAELAVARLAALLERG